MQDTIKLQYITDEGVARLKADFKSNLQHYKAKDNSYFLQYLKEGNYLLDSPFECSNFVKDLKFSKDTDVAELENIKTVYTALKGIPTFVAMDERLWTGMTHTLMWDYVKKRRKDEAFTDGVKNQEDAIFNSFFTVTKHGKKRGTFINCVSRLWWIGYLSYDKDNADNPFWLTELISRAGTIIPISSSNILSRKETLFAVLSITKKKREEGHSIKRDDMFRAISYLNLFAGMAVLDSLGRDEIEAMVDAYYNKNVRVLA